MNWNILQSNALEYKMWKYKVALNNCKYNNKHCNSNAVILDCSKFSFVHNTTEIRNGWFEIQNEALRKYKFCCHTPTILLKEFN